MGGINKTGKEKAQFRPLYRSRGDERSRRVAEIVNASHPSTLALPRYVRPRVAGAERSVWAPPKELGRPWKETEKDYIRPYLDAYNLGFYNEPLWGGEETAAKEEEKPVKEEAKAANEGARPAALPKPKPKLALLPRESLRFTVPDVAPPPPKAEDVGVDAEAMRPTIGDYFRLLQGEKKDASSFSSPLLPAPVFFPPADLGPILGSEGLETSARMDLRRPTKAKGQEAEKKQEGNAIRRFGAKAKAFANKTIDDLSEAGETAVDDVLGLAERASYQLGSSISSLSEKIGRLRNPYRKEKRR